MSNIVKSLKCKELELRYTDLSQGTTTILVETLTRVRKIVLVDVTLEVEELCKYSGKGQCHEITVGGTTKSLYSQRLKIWTKRVDWVVVKEDPSVLTLTPKSNSTQSPPSSSKKVIQSESEEEGGCLGGKFMHFLRRKFDPPLG